MMASLKESSRNLYTRSAKQRKEAVTFYSQLL
jgi:hypothetical protein